jgi:hypothetical protein
MRVLLIDDTRTEDAPNIMRKVDLIARNYWTGIAALNKLGPWDVLLLDHDLNSFVEGTNKEYTGYDIMLFLEEEVQAGRESVLPGRIEIVSSNPVGRKRMQVVIDKLYNKEKS